MAGTWHRKAWFLIAALAICAALLLMLLPYHQAGAAAWLAMLPIFFVGMISARGLLVSLANVYAARVPDPPALPSSFQRPPPIQLA